MSWDRIEGDWKAFRGSAKKRWAELTDDDLDTVAGKRDALAGHIQRRYRIEQEEAHRQIDDWMKEPGVLDDWNDRRSILDL